MRCSTCAAADDASVAILRFYCKQTLTYSTNIFSVFNRFNCFSFLPCMMAGRKKEHRSSRSREKGPTGVSQSEKSVLEMPVLTPQLTMKAAVDDGSTRPTALDKRLREIQNLSNITPILDKFSKHGPSHSISRSQSPMQRLEEERHQDDIENLDFQNGGNGRYGHSNGECNDEHETSSEGLASSDYEPPPAQLPSKERKRGLAGYCIPRVQPSTVQRRQRSRSHDRRFEHHADRHGRRGMRVPDKGLKRNRTPSPEYNEYWYDYSYDAGGYDNGDYDNEDYENDRYEQDYEEDDEYNYDDGYGDYEFDESDNGFEYDRRYKEGPRDNQKFHYQTTSVDKNLKNSSGKDEWDAVQAKMNARFARKKARRDLDKPRVSHSRDRSTLVTPSTQPNRKSFPSSTAAGSQAQLDARLADQLIAQSVSTPKPMQKTVSPPPPVRVATPPPRRSTTTPLPSGHVDTPSTTKDRVIKLAKETFDQVTKKSAEITEDYAKIVDDALRLVLVDLHSIL